MDKKPLKNEEEKNNNSISDSISGTNTSKEEDNKLVKLKNDLNFAIETLNYEQAIIFCKKILFFTPDDIEIYHTLSDLYLKIYDISSSITCLRKIVLVSKKNEKNLKLNIDLKNLLFCKGILEGQSSGKLESDLDLLSQINNNELTFNDYFFFDS